MNIDYQIVEKNIVNWLKRKVKEAGADGAVVGLSGGIDSAVTAVLLKKAFGDNVLGVVMPCHSSRQDREDAHHVTSKFSIEYIETDLSDVFDQFYAKLKKSGIKDDELAAANIKPRLRMTALYYYASSLNYLVVGTDNRSELKIGYFTKYGDGGIDLAPLGMLVKTEVRELAEHLGIPKNIIEKKPSAGLWQGQTDEGEMGFSYEQLDNYILNGQVEDEIKEKIEKLAKKNSHKLKPVPVPVREEIIK